MHQLLFPIFILKMFFKTQHLCILYDGTYYVLEIFPVAQMVKNLPAMQETWARSLG